MLVYRLHTLDVWGNETDGYEVNDAFNRGFITLKEDFNDSELLDAIDNKIGLQGREYAEIDDFGALDFIEIRDKSNGMPVFHLYLDEEESAELTNKD